MNKIIGLIAVFAANICNAQDPELGKQTYMTVCVACHQPTGLGLPPVFPTLSKTDYVTGAEDRLIGIVLKGIAGPLTVNGMTFNNVMPPQEAMLTDEKIAAVLTFVRTSFENTASPISVETVSRTRKALEERKAPWTEAELKEWKSTGSGK